jgi:hypothetical protein
MAQALLRPGVSMVAFSYATSLQHSQTPKVTNVPNTHAYNHMAAEHPCQLLL